MSDECCTWCPATRKEDTKAANAARAHEFELFSQAQAQPTNQSEMEVTPSNRDGKNTEKNAAQRNDRIEPSSLDRITAH
ncbi:hypothetical protein CVT25_002605 [Psilocybe cyanescens]|uniref:Uncharacterized protein n=1 Tax=Psilocybe cyanescens TaxID=93625 RepID=A0A409XWF2_PSICY|nr:hypothetical protein CVT25_002605 [Psilocybe cyanescens]